MAHCEVDSFVTKFKHLWHAGFKATLTVEAVGGEASVVLTAGLGPIPPPLHVPRHHAQHSRWPYRGPSYQRRQETRQAAREEAAEQVPSPTVEVSDDTPAGEAGNTSTAEQAATRNTSVEHTDVDLAEQAKEDFPCHICDFVSNWESGLQIHMSRKHSNIEQVDGNDTFTSEDLEEDDKYSGTSHYWKTGRLGTVYQTFLDANNIIDHSNLTEERKSHEKANVLEARKRAFGANFNHVPPWNQKL